MSGLAATGFDLMLCALILGAALAAIAVRDLFGAVVFFIVYGVFVALAWLRLEAIDVALTEAALGAGLTGVLMIGAVSRLERLTSRDQDQDAAGPQSPPTSSAARIATMVGAAGIGGGLAWGFITLPPSAGLQLAVAENLAASGVENPVTAVLLNFRGWDTLLESIVLLAALIALWSLARDQDWGRRPGLRQHARPGGVMATFGRLLPPFGFLLGVYLVWTGSAQPGEPFRAAPCWRRSGCW
ncbi:hydrogenase subunit MbhD domain-containing protein [Blastomonas aquatica]|uniref:hydrogenase subunit MbhD domain-containing protein n=1 Tax=Blastomonas aquatica TaxID=1510276 RepID=UPI003610C2F9